MRRWLVRLLTMVILVVALGGAALWLFLRGSLAQLDGQVAGPGLKNQVTITRDAQGVPTITGQSRADLAFATGFLHGQERFFQMDLLRRAAAGELAELFGPVALPADRAHRFFRFRHHAEEMLVRLGEEDRQLLQRYSDGVNEGLKALSTRPPDYLLTATSPRPWQPEDCLLVVWAMYVDLQGTLEPREWSRGWMKQHSGAEQISFLLPDSSLWDAPLDAASPLPPISVPDQAPDWWQHVAAGKAAALEPDNLYGSNNWAIAGGRTADGRAILANDMHLGLGLPPVWYRLMLIDQEVAEHPRRLIGVTLPGAPLLVVGSNGHVAWGFTNSAGDYLDLLHAPQDDARPGQVLLGADWVTPRPVEETILVKGAPAEKLALRETDLGPLREVDGQLYAIHWLAQDPGAVNLGLRQMEGAETVTASLQIGAAAGIPSQNMLVADDHGHIGWTIAGPLPDRGDGPASASFPLEPAELASSWRLALPPSSHPRIEDPMAGQLQTANSRTLMGEGSRLIGDGGFYLGPRTRQIRDDLRALGNGVDETGAFSVMLDDRALFLEGWRARALELLDAEALAGHPERADFKRLLTDSWDGHASVNSVGYRLARDFLYAMYDQCFAGLNDQLAKLDRGANYRLATRRWPMVLESLVKAQPAAWLPPGHKDWREVQLAAIDNVIADVIKVAGKLDQARWGQRNRTNIGHPFAKFLPLLRPFLVAPARELAGDSDMPRVAAPDFGPSERLVVAPGKEESGIFNLPGGQSGHPLSPFFLAGFEDWAQAKPAPLLPGAPKYALVLTPQ